MKMVTNNDRRGGMKKSYPSQKVGDTLLVKHKGNELARMMLIGFDRGMAYFQMDTMSEVEVFCEDLHDYAENKK
jgi:hypothetical protein